MNANTKPGPVSISRPAAKAAKATPTTEPLSGTPVSLGEGMEAAIDGDYLTIRIDLTNRGGTSGSGKSINVATTGGNQKVPGTDVVLGLNAYVKNPDYRK